ncbi:MAG: tetratricopeptide repeat protein [Hydrogenophaga sp.]|uniref:tetratricopeptide repeat protein n=1 Tax=Hydrogenophaga sp. TaxID=1904254 RepID=UPI001D8C3E0C|nr:tetratricopeptide repeat protein [Hydrogenophaga sp.]MBX3611559.1 tetratricopeptide repeat protein [Hydrogenophaga sp.]
MADAVEQAKAHFFAGNAHFEAGRFDAARTDYEAALAHVPGRPSVLANLGITLCRLGHWREALVQLQAAVQADDAHVDAWAALGLAREALDDFAGAAQALRRAMALGAPQAGLRLSLAMCELQLAHAREALQALDEALQIDPGLAEAWTQRGHMMRHGGQLDEAARCFRQAMAHGSDDELHRFFLAAVSDVREPPPPPALYARALFDRYADDFQDHLLAQLRYTAPQTLLNPLVAAGVRWQRVLDLGCGTGLCARVLAPNADAIDGVDVAEEMVQRAQDSGLYRQVVRADLLDALRDANGHFDLIVAADVFIYVGALDAVFAAVTDRLAPGSTFAFCVEQADEGRALQLRPSLRYAHGRAAIEALAKAGGLNVEALWSAPIREDQRQPVMGWYVHLRRPLSP